MSASQLQFGWRDLIQKNDSLDLLYDPQDYYDVVKEAMGISMPAPTVQRPKLWR